MTKAEIVTKISNNLGLEKNEVLATVETLMQEIKESLNNGENVYLRGFGSFVVRNRKARVACNPKSKEMVDVPSKKVPFFKAGNDLRKVVNA